MHQLTLDRSDLVLLRGAVGRATILARSQLELLRLADSRELLPWERYTLPAGMQEDSRADLADQIDPWISLVSRYEGLLQDIQTALDTED